MPTASEITRHYDGVPPPGESPWVLGTRPQENIEVVAPNPSWPKWYATLADLILRALGSAVLGLDHVGSTSVPGLHAKPVIDIDLTVADSSAESAWLPALERAGFVLTIREPWWHEHRCLVRAEPRCNLHVFSPGCPEPLRHRMFRDWLATHPKDLSLYRRAKVEAATAANTKGEHVMEYNARKEPAVRDIYDRVFRAAGLV